MVITSSLVEAFQVCASNAYWRARGEPAPRSTEADWYAEQRTVHREHALRWLTRECRSGEVFTGNLDRAALATGSWRWGAGCRVSIDSWVTVLDAAEVSGRNRHRLTPIRFVLEKRITRKHRLLLAFDGLVLNHALGRPISVGRLIHGEHYAAQAVALPPLTKAVHRLLADIASTLRGSTVPRPLLGRQCPRCEYYAECRRLAIEADDLSLLPGMTAKGRKAWGDRGIFTVTQLSYTFRPRRRTRRLADRPEKYRHELKALAIRERKIHVVGQPEMPAQGTPVYLDVEGQSHWDTYFLIGARVATPTGLAQHSFWADSGADEPRIWADFLTLLATLPTPRLLHYGSFEAAFLRQMTARHGAPQDAAVAEALATPVNVLSIIYGHVYFPTYSNGLKDHARFLGFEWTEPGASGLDVLRWRATWERTRDPALKQKVIQYNADDCEALRRVTNFVSALSPSAASRPTLDVVRADSLPRLGFRKWGQVQFCIPELEEINRAAYWDYQRDRISLGRRVDRRRKAAARVHRRPPVNRTISLLPLLSCPKCGNLRLYQHAILSKTVVDVRFSRTGVRRWVTRYLFDNQRCPKCRSVFHTPDRPWTGEKFGPSLHHLVIFQNIELGMPLSTVGQFLTEVLGLNVPRSTVHRFKDQAAEYYADTYRGILNRLVTGNLIHADETQVNLESGLGYVWVFTSLDEVAYVYAPTREADLVRSLLKNFTGVLVSDFYNAYESLSCPQQRCLIHLIRDLNDDLRGEPFNKEMQGLAMEFAALLRPIITTVDRFGLKARFLRKHKAQADRFFDRLDRRSYQTELAQKCQERLTKNRNTLFTFCDYDGVPWNNNNAEHAIKALVDFRRQVSGVASEKGMQEHLTLLSLCETCRYKGVSFLEFLRSGEKDVAVFADVRRNRRRRHDDLCPRYNQSRGQPALLCLG